MTNPVLSVANLGKRYATFSSNLGRFASWFGYVAKQNNEHWAVRDVSFDLPKGSALAIIGQNGAGKSTLLKLITGTVRSTSGSVQVQGRVSAILELGLGFNPDFTARQNVFLAGGLMGLSSDVLRSLIPEIEQFTELGEFFDMPVRVFSSGMSARLAFAVATAVRPEILIVDEVLSVGDSYFQHKSFARIREFREQGTSILLVTHSLQDVRVLCDRVILLGDGQVLKDGPPDEVVDFYNALIAEKENAKLSIEQYRSNNGWVTTRSGSREASVAEIKLLSKDTGESIQLVRVDQEVVVSLSVKINQDIPRLVLGYMLRDRQGNIIWGSNTWHTQQIETELKAGTLIHFNLNFRCALGPGSYSFSPALVSSDVHTADNFEWIDNALVFDVMNADFPFFLGSNHLDAKFQASRG